MTEVHAEKTQDIIGDITLWTDRRAEAMPRYEEVLALIPQVDVLGSQPVRRLILLWADEMRLSFDGPWSSEGVRSHLMRALFCHKDLAIAIRDELGVVEEISKTPGGSHR